MSDDDPLVDLSCAETSSEAACAFVACLKRNTCVHQAAVYVHDPAAAGFHLQAKTSSCGPVAENSALPLDAVALEAVKSEEDRHACAGDIASDSPLRHVFNFDDVSAESVVQCCILRGRKEKKCVLSVVLLLCRGPGNAADRGGGGGGGDGSDDGGGGDGSDDGGGRPLPVLPMSTLRAMLAGSLQRLLVNQLELQNLHSDCTLWSHLYDLFQYRDDSTKLVLELCRVAKGLIGGDAMMFYLDELNDKLLCTIRNLEVPKKDMYMGVKQSPYGTVVANSSSCVIDNLESYPDSALILDDTGRRPTSLICAAISTQFVDGHQEMVGVLAISSYDEQCYTSRHLHTVRWLVEHIKPLYVGALLNDRLCLSKVHTEALLLVSRRLFSCIEDMSLLLKGVMESARDLINAERCSLFLVQRNSNNQDELVAAVFDGEAVNKEKTRKVSMSHSIGGMVARSGCLANITDVMDEPLFCQEVDKETGFKTRNMLCFPILGQNDSVLGVAQLINKINGLKFTAVDEELAKSFAVYCGISIWHSTLFAEAQRAHHRSRLATELMAYHMQKHNEGDLERLVARPSTIPPESRPYVVSFKFVHKSLEEMTVMQILVGMFEEMGFLRRFKIPKDTLCRFLLTVKQGYRHPPYHNWDHAFAVAHFCYCLWVRCQRMKYLTDLEVFALFVGCLCHDIDHRGTNNAFQVNAHSVLAALYSSEGSVMEHHHFAQTMCILNIENCNILNNLSAQEYQRVLDVIREVILATDIAVHLSVKSEIAQMVAGGINERNPRHKNLLLSLITTCCDLNSSTKPWADAQESAEKIYMEFFTQGDLEKALDLSISTMTDRYKACIPEQQQGFSQGIAEPAYDLLHQVYPQTGNVLQRLRANQFAWGEMKEKLNARKNSLSLASSSRTSVTFSAACSSPDEDDIMLMARRSVSKESVDSDIAEETSTSVAITRAQLHTESDDGCEDWDEEDEFQSAPLYRSPLPPADAGDPLPDQLFAPTSEQTMTRMRHLRLRVYDTYMSRRASHLIGADYTLQAAQLQAGSGAPMDLGPRRRVGQFVPPLVDRVTDPVHGKLEIKAKALAEVARAQAGHSLRNKTSCISLDAELSGLVYADTVARPREAPPSPLPTTETTSDSIFADELSDKDTSTPRPARHSAPTSASDRTNLSSTEVSRPGSPPFRFESVPDGFGELKGSFHMSAERRESFEEKKQATLQHSVSDYRLFQKRRSSAGMGKKRPGGNLVARRTYPHLL